jgi:hypothetical protein
MLNNQNLQIEGIEYVRDFNYHVENVNEDFNMIKLNENFFKDSETTKQLLFKQNTFSI